MSLAKYYFPQIFGFKKKAKCGVYHIQTQINYSGCEVQ